MGGTGSLEKLDVEEASTKVGADVGSLVDKPVTGEFEEGNSSIDGQ